jgi:hypothetical protein
MQDRADPHARERALDIARQDPPPSVSADAAAVAIAEVLNSIGDTCPECLADDGECRDRRVPLPSSSRNAHCVVYSLVLSPGGAD